MGTVGVVGVPPPGVGVSGGVVGVVGTVGVVGVPPPVGGVAGVAGVGGVAGVAGVAGVVGVPPPVGGVAGVAGVAGVVLEYRHLLLVVLLELLVLLELPLEYRCLVFLVVLLEL